VYSFGAGRADGSAADRDRLGGKGAYLAEMSRLGLPVPPGFTISAELCSVYYELGRKLPEELKPMVSAALDEVGKIVGAGFGDVQNPLLVSVRSGSRASMPGMMDTVLNLGLNDQTVEGLAVRSGDRRFAYDTYRRFIQMYADVVLGLDHELFEEILENYKGLKGLESTLSSAPRIGATSSPASRPWSRTSSARPSRRIFTRSSGAPSPPCSALGRMPAPSPIAACTIFPTIGVPRSACRPWYSAIWARRARPASCSRATLRPAPTSFTASSWSMRKARTWWRACARPQPLTEAARSAANVKRPSLEALMPAAFAELKAACAKLEAHFHDIQDIEFTCRTASCSCCRPLGQAFDAGCAQDRRRHGRGGAHHQREAVKSINADQLEQLLHPTLDPTAEKTVLAKGLPASPGAASGELVFDADEAVHLKAQGHNVILGRVETRPRMYRACMPRSASSPPAAA
jgi:pyruvate,orthophosphate dikinase